MEKIIIIGAGGHAAEIVDYIDSVNKLLDSNEYEIIGLIDDNEDNYKHYEFKYEFLGKIEEHKINEDNLYVMGIANLAFRKVIIEKFKLAGAKFTSFIHPTSIISPTAIIGEGVVVSHNVSIGPKVVIGDFNMLNSRCTIGHDSVIGNYNFISPQVAIGGNTKIGDENLFGTNSCTIPGMKIGNKNRISAGMVADKPIQDNETIFYRFKEKFVFRN